MDALVPNVEVSLKTRSRPKMLAETIANLIDEQKTVVTDMGFGSLLKLILTEIPGTFARYVASCLNTDDMVINTPNGNIPVDRMAVHEVLGFPMGHKKIQRKRVSNYDTPLALQWKKHSRNSLKPVDIANRIKETTTADRMFQVDFLVLMATTMISAMSSNTINREYLTSLTEDFVSKEFDWCEYVVYSLKKCKEDWDPTNLNSYFTGPLTFLMLLYCDRVSVMLEPPVERNRLVIAEWKGKDLKRREEAEIGNGGYGLGELVVEWKKTAQGKQYRRKVLAEHGSKDAYFEGCGCTTPVLEDDEVEEEEETEVGYITPVSKDVNSSFCDTSQGRILSSMTRLDW